MSKHQKLGVPDDVQDLLNQLGDVADSVAPQDEPKPKPALRGQASPAPERVVKPASGPDQKPASAAPVPPSVPPIIAPSAAPEVIYSWEVRYPHFPTPSIVAQIQAASEEEAVSVFMRTFQIPVMGFSNWQGFMVKQGVIVPPDKLDLETVNYSE